MRGFSCQASLGAWPSADDMGLTHCKCNLITWLQQKERRERLASAQGVQVLRKTILKVDEIERTCTQVPLTAAAFTRQAQPLLGSLPSLLKALCPLCYEHRSELQHLLVTGTEAVTDKRLCWQDRAIPCHG